MLTCLSVLLVSVRLDLVKSGSSPQTEIDMALDMLHFSDYPEKLTHNPLFRKGIFISPFDGLMG